MTFPVPWAQGWPSNTNFPLLAPEPEQDEENRSSA
jgi:hypothetical protein